MLPQFRPGFFTYLLPYFLWDLFWLRKTRFSSNGTKSSYLQLYMYITWLNSYSIQSYFLFFLFKRLQAWACLFEQEYFHLTQVVKVSSVFPIPFFLSVGVFYCRTEEAWDICIVKKEEGNHGISKFVSMIQSQRKVGPSVTLVTFHIYLQIYKAMSEWKKSCCNFQLQQYNNFHNTLFYISSTPTEEFRPWVCELTQIFFYILG